MSNLHTYLHPDELPKTSARCRQLNVRRRSRRRLSTFEATQKTTLLACLDMISLEPKKGHKSSCVKNNLSRFVNSAPGVQIVERGVQMLGSEINRTLKQATKQNATCTWYDDKLNFNLREDSLAGLGTGHPIVIL